MASGELPPSKKKSGPTTICSLGDDLLCEVFLRLPSLPTLVRAALTCPAFLRAVRSSPKFRRRFRDLHPAPLLGVFLDVYDPGMPAFVPIRRRSDPDHAAAVRGADVFLTRVPDDEDEGSDDEDDGESDSLGWSGYYGGEGDRAGWSMTGCRDGYVVLVNRGTKRAAVYDPLTRSLHLLPAPPVEICEDPEEAEVEFHVITSEEDRRSLRVVFVCKERGKVRVAVFSPDTREWQISPKGARLQLQDDDSGTLVNGCVYWASVSEDAIHLLNTATLQFSRMVLPRRMRRMGLKVGQTSDGKLCLACASELTLDVCFRRADDNGVDKWILNRTFELVDDIDKLRLQFVDRFPRLEVVAIIGGIVYLSTFQVEHPSSSGCFLSFCIETEELKEVCPITNSDSSYPYIMAWPPVLVGNKVSSLG
ncbi:uncharacterized protein LOC119303645 [Triticum dicoccoides]|uniref:uncharacterized protein LOC119303645 n=1 Tax=Triticum dicoccoides TaxID=85692 RepID=UPI00188E3955|nr:uncharacterized protein LOC119303645 [Triticum dicoccoides]